MVRRASAARRRLVRQAGAFGPEHDRHGPAQVARAQRRAVARRRSRARQSARSRSAAMIAASGCGARRSASGTCCPCAPRSAFHPNGSAVPSPQMIAVAPHAFRRADDRADVARVLHADQQQDQRRAGASQAPRERGRAAARDRHDPRRLADRAHRSEHLCRHADDARAGALRLLRATASVGAARPPTGMATTSTGTCERTRLLEQMRAVEQHGPPRPPPRGEIAEAADERILPAGDAFHRGGDCTRTLLPSLGADAPPQNRT